MDLSDRMRNYEAVTNTTLMKKTPVVARIDGKSFHTFTKGLNKPFDDILMGAFAQTAKKLCENIQGAGFAYTQSDEISLVICDWDSVETESWFGYRTQKLVSVIASMATLFFNNAFADYVSRMGDAMADGLMDMNQEELTQYIEKVYQSLFDVRVFNLPPHEVSNYFIWRQADAMRNSVQMVGQANFSSTELNNKTVDEVKKMLLEKSVEYEALPTNQKRGACIIKQYVENPNDADKDKFEWVEDKEIPIFLENRDYIELQIFEEGI